MSGAVSPFNRPGLGPWLKDDRLDTWDAICVAKLDRLTRSLFDFVNLVSWLEARGKTLICLDPHARPQHTGRARVRLGHR